MSIIKKIYKIYKKIIKIQSVFNRLISKTKIYCDPSCLDCIAIIFAFACLHYPAERISAHCFSGHSIPRIEIERRLDYAHSHFSA